MLFFSYLLVLQTHLGFGIVALPYIQLERARHKHLKTMPNFPLLPKVLYFSLKSTEILYFSKIMLSASNYSIFDVIYLPPLNSAHFYLRNWKRNGKQMLIVGQMLFQRKDLYS